MHGRLATSNEVIILIAMVPLDLLNHTSYTDNYA